MAARTCFRARAPVSHPSPQTPEPPSFVLRVFRSRARLVPLFCACVRRSCCVFRIAQYLPMFDLLFFPPTFPFFLLWVPILPTNIRFLFVLLFSNVCTTLICEAGDRRRARRCRWSSQIMQIRFALLQRVRYGATRTRCKKRKKIRNCDPNKEQREIRGQRRRRKTVTYKGLAPSSQLYSPVAQTTGAAFRIPE